MDADVESVVEGRGRAQQSVVMCTTALNMARFTGRYLRIVQVATSIMTTPTLPTPSARPPNRAGCARRALLPPRRLQERPPPRPAHRPPRPSPRRAAVVDLRHRGSRHGRLLPPWRAAGCRIVAAGNSSTTGPRLAQIFARHPNSRARDSSDMRSAVLTVRLRSASKLPRRGPLRGGLPPPTVSALDEQV